MSESILGEGFKQIFPSGKRANSATLQTPTFLYARKMTEWNLTNIIRSITDNDSFVITDNGLDGTVNLNDKFEFCIHGYYFCIDSTPENNTSVFEQVTGFSNGPVFAIIELTATDDTSNSYSELNEISFQNSKPNDGIYLQLLEAGPKVPDTSKIKFKQKSLDIDEVSSTILGNITTIDGNYPLSQNS